MFLLNKCCFGYLYQLSRGSIWKHVGVGMYQGGCTVSVDNIFTHIEKALE